MHISWLGNTAFKLQTKALNEDVIITIDTYKPKTGNFPRSLTSHVSLYTRGEKDSITISGNPFTLSEPGECDVKGVLITSAEGTQKGETMVRIDSENLSVGHLGLTNKSLTDRQKELLSDIDILIIPIEHEDAYKTEAAIKVINELEPKIVIPMAFKSDNNPKIKGPEKFLKEMGIAHDIKPEKKVILKKKDLPQEDTQIIILSKE